MALSAWNEDKALGNEPCTTARRSWQCPNMKPLEGDTDMNFEHYRCEKCGRRESLDYDEMR